MKDKLYIQSRLSDLINQRASNSEERELTHKELLDTVTWVFNGGTPKLESEVKQRLLTCIDELKAYSFTHNDLLCRVSVAKIKELNNILQD